MRMMLWSRFRRVEKRGGHPTAHGWPWRQRTIVPFTPEPLEEKQYRTLVEQEVAGLLPYALDEANGGSLDRWIDSWASRWVDDIDAAYSGYLSTLAHEIGGANATLQELRRLRDQDLRDLAEAAVARESTFETLTGRRYPAPARRAPSLLPPVEPLFPPGTQPPGTHSPGTQSPGTPPAGTFPPGAESPGASRTGTQAAGASRAGTQAAGAPEPKHRAEPVDVADGEELEAHLPPGEDTPDYAEPGLVGGRPRSAYLHVGALAVAAAADFGAFSQVVQLVMRSQAAWLTYLVVAGFTASALYLAHAVGTGIRDVVAGVRSARPRLLAVGVGAWAVLGLAATYVRYTVVPTSAIDAAPIVLGGGGGAASQPAEATGPNALLFLGLFIGTGLVAALGAYVTHNPASSAYTRIRDRHAAVYEQLAASEAAVEKAVVSRADQYRLRDEATGTRDRERHRRIETANDLKQYARVLVAKHAQDPAFTDALFNPQRPGNQPPGGPA